MMIMIIIHIQMLFNLFSPSRKNYFKYFVLSSFACLSAFSVTGCTKSEAQDRQELQIVTTILPIHLFTQAVVGEKGQVNILISPGTEIHDYQATPEDAKMLTQANILIKNGLGIETFLENLVANVGNSQLQQIDASEGIKVIEEEEHSTHNHEEEHHHEAGNPHVWLDPVLAQKQVANIRDNLIVADPTNADSYKTNADTYIQQLQQLDSEFSQRLAPLKGCEFITFHNAFPYLAQRYGLHQEAIVEIPEDNITPRDIQRVQRTARQFQVKALITEPGIQDKRIQQISDDLNLPLEAIDPIESGETNPQYYFQVMGNNLEAIVRACS